MSATERKPPTCVVVSPGETFHGKQRLDYFAGISAQSAGATGICMHLVHIPPGGRSAPHLHERHETATCSPARRRCTTARGCAST